MAEIPLSTCNKKIESLKERQNEIIDALDFLVGGF